MGDDAERLYELPLAEFTAERDALAKRLRADGDKAAADEVKALRKPSVPAWAINQAVRADAKALKKLLTAAGELANAQDAALSGKGGDLREAMAAQQEAVEEVTVAAGRALGDDAKPATLDRVRETLRGVAADDDLRTEVEEGRLVRDREAVGFGGAPMVDVAPRTPGRKAAKSSTKKRSGGRTTSKAAAAPAKDSEELRAAKRDLKAAERALATVEKRAANATTRRDVAQAELDRREGELGDAEDELSARQSDVDDARKRVDDLGGR